MLAVSIIVPVYNVETYLPRCIDSILAQTYRDFELILVDDGSPDNCGQICDEYASKDSRIIVIHKSNGGVSRARNSALEIAKGEYIAFCDSDDSWEPQLLEKAVCAFDAHNVDLVSFQYLHHRLDGTCKQSAFPACFIAFNDWNGKMEYFVTQFQRYKLGYEVWSQMFKRSIIEKHHIRFCETCKNFAEDMGFVGKYLLCSNSVVVTDDCLYNLFERESSMMSRSKYVVKFDELNEVSADMDSFTHQILPSSIYKRWYGIVHFFTMYNQYQKLLYTEKYRTFPSELAKIQNRKIFHANTWKTLKSKRELARLFGKRNASRIIILSRFCLHKNWYLYALDRRIFYFLERLRTNEEMV